VARGQRTANRGGRPRANGGDAETRSRACLHQVRRPVAQPPAEAGQEASLECQRARAAGRPCYEAERTPLAVENSVGKPAAQIEAPNAGPGKRVWRTPTPTLAPVWPQGRAGAHRFHGRWPTPLVASRPLTRNRNRSFTSRRLNHEKLEQSMICTSAITITIRSKRARAQCAQSPLLIHQINHCDRPALMRKSTRCIARICLG